MPIYNTSLLSVDAKECRRYAGLMKADFDESVIEEACMEAQLLAAPKGVYEIYDYDAEHQTVLSDPPFKLEGKLIAKHLREAEKVVMMAVTVGDDIEDHVTKYFEQGRYAYSVILDAAATTAVEQVADGLEKAVAPKIKKMGYKTRWRFSPGYGDWPLTCQPEMVRVASAASIGVRLSDSLMLMPRKSVTAIVGLVPESAPDIPEAEAPAMVHPAQGCAACNMKMTCDSSREK